MYRRSECFPDIGRQNRQYRQLPSKVSRCGISVNHIFPLPNSYRCPTHTHLITYKQKDALLRLLDGPRVERREYGDT